MSFETVAASLSQEQIVALLQRSEALAQKNRRHEQREQEQDRQVAELKQRIAWLERYMFGAKSERRSADYLDPRQLSLGEIVESHEPPPPSETVRSYERKVFRDDREDELDAGGLRFGSEVPIETIIVEDPALEGLKEGEDFEVVSEKVTHRLAQRPASYVVLKYVRRVVKLRETEKLSTPPAPPAVFEKSYADVSFLAGLLIEKFLYHLPLYRQHQRLQRAGIELSRQTLTNLVTRTAELLTPIYHSQLSSILQSKVLAMDETPVRAGRAKPGKMHTAFYWPLYGDKDEVAFPFTQSRAHRSACEILGSFDGTLLTDGYEAYERYAEKHSGVTHALCWAHARRKFVEAEESHPGEVARALEFVRALYTLEDSLSAADSERILEARSNHSREIVDEFFSWARELLTSRILLPSDPLTKALSYSLEREEGLRVFLFNPDVQIDTNHLERAIRPIPLGRKNWLFCWTELGAEVVGRVQSLLSTCRLHNVDPFTYLVDVLQRIDSHPMIDIHLLTPRLWKQNFAQNPMRSDLFGVGKNVEI